jgi:hypothetical protein
MQALWEALHAGKVKQRFYLAVHQIPVVLS